MIIIPSPFCTFPSFRQSYPLLAPVVDEMEAIAGVELEGDGRVKIQSWLETYPVALLQSGHVVCSVHHRARTLSMRLLGELLPYSGLEVVDTTHCNDVVQLWNSAGCAAGSV